MQGGRQLNRIKVIIRKRPLSQKQVQSKENDLVRVDSPRVVVLQPKVKVDLTPYREEHQFYFDCAYPESADNATIYQENLQTILMQIVQSGGSLNCFAFGQTGSGKTHTMMGNQADPGIQRLAISKLFQLVSQNRMYVSMSCFQLYSGKLYDLMNQRTQLAMLQDASQKFNIIGLTEEIIGSQQHLQCCLNLCRDLRATADNGINPVSSRSHAILQIKLLKDRSPFAIVNFIDLAGSERGKDHPNQIDKQARLDGAQINKSLLALKECIRAMDLGKQHTPFRGSKLTMILRESFIGRSITIMIGNISPNAHNIDITLNTLRYADRVKEIKKPTRTSRSRSRPREAQSGKLPPKPVQSFGELHKQRVREMVECLREEQLLLREVQQVDSDIKAYLSRLSRVLQKEYRICQRLLDQG